MNASRALATYVLATPMTIAIAVTNSRRGVAVKSPSSSAASTGLCTLLPPAPQGLGILEEHRRNAIDRRHRVGQLAQRGRQLPASFRRQPVDGRNQPLLRGV